MLDGSLLGRHALVCGASRGIGRATALALAAAGAEVTVLARGWADLQALLPELEAAGAPRAAAVQADLDDRDELDAVVDNVLTDRAVHVLVHNTGGPPGGPLLAASEAALTRAFGRHVLTAQLLARKIAPYMIDAGFGRIVTVTSTSVREPIDNLGVSNLTRAAMASWVKTLSRELPPGVTINNVMPGYTDTERLASLAEATAAREGLTEADVRDRWIAQIPEGRLARADEIAAAIAFLCSPAASYVRGVSLAVDGGRLRGI